ncbi:uncharacterized protein TM35_000032290 [Trypanosoma theileri]|uniref:Uncharacterized protein n=1 Tax=Trypanosoma theileri TaxID=67003 RepID=A0A1X0P6A6_9TRYP|nr:uncharacterized protein TM35_000032290 [Trypanosoma theileri]ORC92476.1 hypothetical protein TM35_000032290 [Trypanosoma theileri]
MNRENTRLLRFLLGCGCLLTLTLAASQAEAVTLGCENVWTGPNANNSISDCLKNRDRIGKYWRYYVYPGFAALFFVLLLLLFPFFFLFCICNGCCCRKNCFPTSPAQHYNGNCFLFLPSVIAILWGAGATVAIIMGAHTMYTGARDVENAAREKTALYFNNTANNVLKYASSNATSGEEGGSSDVPAAIVSGVNVMFDVSAKIIKNIDDFDDKYFKYVRDAAIVSYALGALPFILLLFTLLFALKRISRGVPACFSCIYFVVALVFSLLAIIFLGAAYFASAANGEMEKQIKRQSGVLQWYVVPYMSSHYIPGLVTLDTALRGLVTERLQTFCTSLNSKCDALPDFTVTKPFFCEAPVECVSSSQLMELMRTMPVKDPTLCTPEASDAPSETSCTVATCETRCGMMGADPNAVTARNASVEVMGLLRVSNNATIAENFVRPLQEPNAIADTLLWAGASLPDVREGFWMAGTGYFMDTLMLILGLCVMLRGRTVWGDYMPRDKKA